MTDILTVFAWLEGLLLAGSLLSLVWGVARGWELEIVVPIYMAFIGTVILAACLLITVVVHDHVHIGVS